MYKQLLTITVCLAVLGGVCSAQDPDLAPTPDEQPTQSWLEICLQPFSVGAGVFDDWLNQEQPTNNWFGYGDVLTDNGITFVLGFTQSYQLNLNGGTSTHRRAGRWAGVVSAEIELDLEQIASIPGAVLFVASSSSWSDGIDATSVGSAVGSANGFAGGDRSLDVTELWYQQNFFEDRLRLRVGKIDLTGGFTYKNTAVAFDANAFANDAESQFINAALANNPTIPFPDPGLAFNVFVEPFDGMYVSVAVGDAQADVRETGFSTTFHEEDYFFGILETGFVPVFPSANGELPGAYRFGVWYDPQPKERFDRGTNKRDDIGFYMSFDQMLLRESDTDSQGLGMFGRFGFAHSDQNEINLFYSFGMQYEGLIPTRNGDVIGIGFARGDLTRDAGYTESAESVLEMYYSAIFCQWLTVTPSIQHIWHPGGMSDNMDATVVSIRMQMAF